MQSLYGDVTFSHYARIMSNDLWFRVTVVLLGVSPIVVAILAFVYG
jgi:hypothetical protein